MNIGAKTPEEIAISVLAEIIEEKFFRYKEQVIIEMNSETKELDPVCGMLVTPNKAKDSYLMAVFFIFAVVAVKISLL